MDDRPNMRDVCTVGRFNRIPLVVTRQSTRGVQVPKGIGKLKELQKMGLVNLARGDKIVGEIKTLTRLRKLAVTGVGRRNTEELCSAIANLICLESLLLRAEGDTGLLGCLHGIFSPPIDLRSLKLYGNLGELPSCIGRLVNLVKLTLRSTRILDANAIDTLLAALGKLPNLTILRLLQESFKGPEVRFSFHVGAFPSLVVMEFDRPNRIRSVVFEEGAMPKLELLDFCAWRNEARAGLLTGLPCLKSLKQFTLSGSTYDDGFVEDLRTQATALSVGKSVLDGALGYAKSTLAEEVALQLGIQRDHAFIRDELAMMQAFLRAAHGERRGDHEVLMTWVKQVRDVAYDAEDCLQDFSIHLRKPSWWRLPCTLGERRRIAKQMKDLRARVEDVSQRNLRYQLLKSAAGSKSATLADEQSNTAAAAIFGIDEAWRAEKHENLKVDLVRLINTEDENLRVISVWGTSGDLGQASIINEAYENPIIKKKFPCRAWVRILHPFNPNDFIQSLVKQFRSAVGIGILLEAEKTGQELAEEFARYVNDRSFLVVLNWLSTFEEWKGIRACFPNNKKGSRIIVCTPQAEVASLCAGKESQVLELKQLSTDQTIYAFSEKVLFVIQN
ncbi:hypothetical protein U9M48_038013 [Paspalum notatum var. saurae]|uniref:Rx N-terminal domain-containing protein n=1 Tax=Paspalum notatum var. saurae TaxID=547442 RepID=A0AAQ3XB88_PASNO